MWQGFPDAAGHGGRGQQQQLLCGWSYPGAEDGIPETANGLDTGAASQADLLAQLPHQPLAGHDGFAVNTLVRQVL